MQVRAAAAAATALSVYNKKKLKKLTRDSPTRPVHAACRVSLTGLKPFVRLNPVGRESFQDDSTRTLCHYVAKQRLFRRPLCFNDFRFR